MVCIYFLFLKAQRQLPLVLVVLLSVSSCHQSINTTVRTLCGCCTLVHIRYPSCRKHPCSCLSPFSCVYALALCDVHLECSIHTIFLNSFSLCFSSTTTVVLHFCIVQLNPYTPSSIPFPFLNKMIETFQCHTNEQKDDHHEQCQYKNDHKD